MNWKLVGKIALGITGTVCTILSGAIGDDKKKETKDDNKND